MQDDKFEWDDTKADSNRRKHGVTFDEARSVFADLSAIDEIDDDPDEERWKRTGEGNGRLLTVIYVERRPRIRIISARKATQHEQDDYYRR